MLAAVILSAWAAAPAQTPASAPARKGECFALVLGGQPASPVFARRYQDWTKRFAALLTSAGVPAGNIVTIVCDDKKPGKEAILSAVAELARKVQPQDQFILFMVGHGNLGETMPAFSVPGPDLEAQEFATALKSITARNQVFLNFTQTSGEYLKYFAQKGRVNIAGVNLNEAAEPVYAEFFLRGLESKRADGEGSTTSQPAGKKDGAITLLEAYNWAVIQNAQWIVRQSTKVGEKVWAVDGKESVEIFKKLYEGQEGQEGARALASDSSASKTDEIIDIIPPQGEESPFWLGRRIVTEHAVLEDCGEETPACALNDDAAVKGYAPLSGKTEREPGHLARRVVLGQPELLPEEK
jgi:hypothetical protein